MYDDQLGLAVLELQAMDDPNMPRLGYAGGAWQDSVVGGSVISINVSTALQEHLFKMVKNGVFKSLPGYRSPGVPESTIDRSTRPTFKEEHYVLCAP